MSVTLIMEAVNKYVLTVLEALYVLVILDIHYLMENSVLVWIYNK